MSGLYEDLRYGLRALIKYRRFTAVCVFSLALGIGANTTIFTLINAVLLRPLPVKDPATLAALYTLDAHNPGFWGCSLPNYRDYRDRNQVFSSLLLYTGIGINVTGNAEPRLVMGQLVSANYFTALGVNPVMGRGFLPEEDSAAGASRVAVISNRFWHQQYGGDRAILSRTVSFNDHPYKVVGVAPDEFQGLNTLQSTDVWIPIAMFREIHPTPAMVEERRFLAFAVVGRLKPGVSMPQAQAAMQTLTHDLEREHPADNADRKVFLTTATDASIPPGNRAEIERTSTVLLVVSAIVLIIACGNLANLLLARAASRVKEITVRLALGASRWRLIRQLLVESVLLSVVGGLIGLAFAVWARNILWSMRPPAFLRVAAQMNLDRNVLLYNFVVAIVTGLVFGLVPAMKATSTDLASDLKERSGLAVHTGRWNPRSMLVMSQVAFSVVALVGAGLFVRSLRNAFRADPGFDSAHLGVIVFNVADRGYSQAQGREFRDRALERVRAVPGVRAASLANDWPLHVTLQRTMTLEDREIPPTPVLSMCISPGFLAGAGIPLEHGRDFSDQDQPTSPHVVIVNQTAADRYWPGENPVGKRAKFFNEPAPVEVIGVAKTAHYQAIGEKPQPFAYFSAQQYYFPVGVIWVRTAGEPDVPLAAARRVMQELDRNLPLQSETVNTTIRGSLWAQRLSAGLLGTFGLLALVLATVGIYGVVSYLVARRVREFGIRMALGATPADVQMMLLREGVRLVAGGVLVGMILALIASRAIQPMLYVVSSRDAATFILVPALLTLVAVLACWVPALRATRIDPMTALREE